MNVIVGDATAFDDVVNAMAGQDAVISALGRGKSVRADGLFTRAAEAVVAAATETDVSRLVWLSSFGVGDTYASANTVQKLMYRTFLRDIYANKKVAEVLIRSSGLDWTLVYPSALTNGPARGVYRADDRVKMKLLATVSRAYVAEFMQGGPQP